MRTADETIDSPAPEYLASHNSLTLQAKLGLNPAGPDNPWAAAHPAQGSGRVQAQLPAVLDEQVGDLLLLEASPQILDRVELGGVGREPLQPQPARLSARSALTGWRR